MMNNKQSYKIPVIASIILHAILFAFLFMHFSPKKMQTPKNVQIVNAVAINENQLVTSMPNNMNDQKPNPPAPKSQPISQNTIRHIEQAALKQPEVAKVNTAMPIPPKPKQKVVQETTDLELQEPAIDPKIEEKKRQEEAKHKEEIRKAEIKKQEAQLAKKQKEEEAKQLQRELAFAAKQQKAEQVEETSDNSDENLAAELSTEKKQLHSSQTATAQDGEVDKYKQQIIQAVSRKWLMPETDNKELSCQLLVHVAPGGVVISVDIIKESGNSNLDRSARNAIMKASPLPVPENSELFDNFRALRLTFRPQGIISG